MLQTIIRGRGSSDKSFHLPPRQGIMAHASATVYSDSTRIVDVHDWVYRTRIFIWLEGPAAGETRGKSAFATGRLFVRCKDGTEYRE